MAIWTLMYLIYSALLILWGLGMIPVAVYRLLRRGKPLPNPGHSLGFLPDALRSDGRPTIWFHSCSVGETLSVGPLAHDLQQRFPNARLVFSTITHTGQAIAQQRFHIYGIGNAFYFPLDFPWIVRRVLDHLRPAMLVIIDVEIWPHLIRECRRRNIPVVLCNGRISADVFPGYRVARFFLQRVLQSYRLLMMKSEEDAERIRRIGAPPEKVLVTGNIKCDRDLVEREVRKIQSAGMIEALGLDRIQGPIIVAGSTHAPEEAMLLEILRLLRQEPDLREVRLLLAPRHPERFDEVAELARRQGFRVRRRSGPATAENDAEVLLLDSIGELATAYQFGTIAFVGGTLIPHGGQSILEPALYGQPIVLGPSMGNFQQIIDDFKARHAVLQITATSSDRIAQVRQLTEALTHLLRSAAARSSLGRAAASVLEASRGASAVTVSRLAEIFEATRVR